MNGLVLLFVAVAGGALLSLPRRLASLPLLAGVCYITLGQGVEVGPFSFTVLRILIFIGFLRIAARNERISGVNGLDKLIIAWATAALLTSLFHKDPSAAFVNRLGMVANAGGVYFLIRIFCQTQRDLITVCKVVAIVLVPVAMEMLYERASGHNLFSVFGGIPETPSLRNGRFRAQGPFRHAILAGTVGAICLPLVVFLWRRMRMYSAIGVAACVAMVVASASSGPIMSMLAAVGSLLMWRYKAFMRAFRWAALLLYFLLDLIMQAPAYYLLRRIDITGGSTGWYRARLIESGLAHLNEWWLYGTDYTRHWMETGVPWSEDHIDITNQYLGMGVRGGLPLMLLFIAILVKGFSMAGLALRTSATKEDGQRLSWALGSSLFAVAATCISVGFFDQSVLFVYLILAMIGSAPSALKPLHEEIIPLQRNNIGQAAAARDALVSNGPVRWTEPPAWACRMLF